MNGIWGIYLLSWLILLLLGYFLGCLNGSVMVSHFIIRDDVRQHGSGNAGLTNFYRTYGAKYALGVILFDMGKTVVACLLGGAMFNHLFGDWALGVLLGSISFWIPGIPQPVKLGLAGGPLIVAILIGRYGPHYKLVTYTTMSANLMLREVGISLFLAGVGLGAGEEFVPTLAAGGYVWIAYGAVITVVPLLLAGIFGRFYYKLNYYTLIGVLSGASTNPPALAYSAEQTSSDAPSVGYATVYPLSMFLRVLAAQLLILIFG